MSRRPAKEPPIITPEGLRARLTTGRAAHVIRTHAQRLGMDLESYLVERCDKLQKFCPECERWKPLGNYRVDLCRIDGRTSVCRRCLAWNKGDKPPRNNLDWTKDEDAHLLRTVGSKHPDVIASELGRSGAAIRRRCEILGIKRRARSAVTITNPELVRYFGTRGDALQQWQKAGGPPTFRVGRTVAARKGAVLRFWRKRPEALDIFSVPDANLDLYDIDLDDWPEPPNFKLAPCKGRRDRPHAPAWATADLYASLHCKVCGRHVGKWAQAYSNDWLKGPLSVELVNLHIHEGTVWIKAQRRAA